jgi:hypothetical protein
MKNNSWIIISVLAIAAVGCFVWGKYQAQQEIEQVTRLSDQRPALIGRKLGDTTWLWLPKRSTRLVWISATDNALRNELAETNLVTFRFDSTSHLLQAIDKQAYKRRLSQLLADSLQADTTTQWLQVKTKLEKFVAREASTDGLKAKDPDALLMHRVWSKIRSSQSRQRATYVLEKELYVQPLDKVVLATNQRPQLHLAIPLSLPSTIWYYCGLAFALVGCGLGIWQGKGLRAEGREQGENEESPFITEHNSAVELEPESASFVIPRNEESLNTSSPVTAPFFEPQNSQEVKVTSALIHRYAAALYEKYGSVFEDLQNANMPPTEVEREKALRKLLTLAFHAHTFAYYGVMDKLDRLEESPNVRLLLHDQSPSDLDTHVFSTFSTLVRETPLKYRALYEILKELNLRELKVLLEDDTYIPKNFWFNEDDKTDSNPNTT